MKMMRLKLILIAALVFSIPAISTELDAEDEFDSLNREDLKALFAEPKLTKGFLTGKMSRDSYNQNQKGKLRAWLNEGRKGWGVAFFHTNGGSYGKLLYTWGIGPKLHLKDIVVFHTKKNLILKSVVLGPAGHMDLDTGEGTHKKAGLLVERYNPDLYFIHVEKGFMFLSETNGSEFIFPMN